MSWAKQLNKPVEPLWHELARQLSAELPNAQVDLDLDSSRMNTLRAGGPIALAVTLHLVEDAKLLMQFIREYELPWMVFSGMSNTLVRDGGYRGVGVILKGGPSSDFGSIEILEEYSEADALRIVDDAADERRDGQFGDWIVRDGILGLDRVQVGAAVPTTKLVRLGRTRGWKAFAPIGGIPGYIGGAVAMNAGSRDIWIDRFLESVDVVDLDGNLKTKKATKLQSRYRFGGLKNVLIVSARINACKYDLDESMQVYDQKQKYRMDTQPTGTNNCGSVFRNPENDSAGRLIEAVGLKGVRLQGAQISQKHANFIENVREATATDIENLIGLAQKKVKDETGIELQRELKIVGVKKNVGSA